MDLLNLHTKIISTYAISDFDDFIFFILFFFICQSTCECLIFTKLKAFPRQFRLFFEVTLLAFTSRDFERKLMYFFWSKMKPELTLTIHKGKLSFEFPGEVGDWKNWYTVSQSERHDALIKKEMQDVDFDLKLIYEI